MAHNMGSFDAAYNKGGYLTLYAPWHPLARRGGRVLVSRAVLYAKIGPGAHPCAHCGTEVEWGSTLQAGHVNGVRLDNSPDNLVPSCGPCNRARRAP